MLSIDEIKNTPIVFIIANGRSGTTLVRTILDASPQTMFPPESKFIIHLKEKYRYVSAWTSKVLDEFIVDLYKDVKFKNAWCIDRVMLRSIIDRYPADQLSFQVLCKIIYLSYPSLFPKTQIRLLGDKNPPYCLYVEELLEIFPDARFIHLIRDYRDNIVSNRKLFKRQNIAALARLWVIYNQLAEASKAKHPSLFYTIRYEDLVTDPATHVKEMCQFLGIDFNPEMLDFHKKTKEMQDKVNSPVINRIHPNIVKPITTDAVNKWQGKLTERELRISDYITQKDGYAESYGYRPTYPEIHSHPLITGYGSLLCTKDRLVIKGYYNSSFVIRDMLRDMSRNMFRWFRITNVYNEGDYYERHQVD